MPNTTNNFNNGVDIRNPISASFVMAHPMTLKVCSPGQRGSAAGPPPQKMGLQSPAGQLCGNIVRLIQTVSQFNLLEVRKRRRYAQKLPSGQAVKRLKLHPAKLWQRVQHGCQILFADVIEWIFFCLEGTRITQQKIKRVKRRTYEEKDPEFDAHLLHGLHLVDKLHRQGRHMVQIEGLDLVKQELRCAQAPAGAPHLFARATGNPSENAEPGVPQFM